MQDAKSAENNYDVAVIGGGVAGLSAAVLLGRARRRVVVIDDGSPRNAPAAHSRGFLTRDGAAPGELVRLGRAEASGYGVEFIEGTVRSLDAERHIELLNGHVLTATRVLLASGVADELPAIPGLTDGWGVDVLHCPYCHAHEAGDGPFVVLGVHPASLHQALLLSQWSPRVTLATGSLELGDDDRAALTARGVRTVDGTIERLERDRGRLLGVHVGDGFVPTATVFVFPTPHPRYECLDSLDVRRTELGLVETDADGCSSLPWLYVAGNAADPRGQLLVAAGDGARVAFALHNRLIHAEAYDQAAPGRTP